MTITNNLPKWKIFAKTGSTLTTSKKDIIEQTLPLFWLAAATQTLNFTKSRVHTLPLLSFIFRLFKQTLQFMWKMSIQYLVPGFEPMTFLTWVSSHNHYTRAPAVTKTRLRLSSLCVLTRYWTFNKNLYG